MNKYRKLKVLPASIMSDSGKDEQYKFFSSNTVSIQYQGSSMQYLKNVIPMQYYILLCITGCSKSTCLTLSHLFFIIQCLQNVFSFNFDSKIAHMSSTGTQIRQIFLILACFPKQYCKSNSKASILYCITKQQELFILGFRRDHHYMMFLLLVLDSINMRRAQKTAFRKVTRLRDHPYITSSLLRCHQIPILSSTIIFGVTTSER